MNSQDLSFDWSNGWSYGLCPVVTLGPGLKLEASGKVNGITNWEISKAN